MRASLVFIFFFVMSLLAGQDRSVQAAELVMFESDGCSWCQRWHEEIGVIYPNTQEGAVLPLRLVDADADFPHDLKDVKGVFYTPTFLIWENGRELGRIRGYPGEDFFWPMLGEFISKHQLHHPISTVGAAPVSEKTSCITSLC